MQHTIPHLYTEQDAANILGLAPATLRNMRANGRGPSFVKVGGLVRYRDADLVEWIESRIRHTTDGNRRRARAM